MGAKRGDQCFLRSGSLVTFVVGDETETAVRVFFEQVDDAGQRVKTSGEEADGIDFRDRGDVVGHASHAVQR